MTHHLLIALAAATLLAADATGTWTGTLTRAEGDGRPLPAHLVLMQEGDKLTGTAGPDAGEQRPIQNGTAKDGKLSFEVRNDDTVMTFTLTQEGEEITGDVLRDREGQTQKAKLAVKRVK